MELLKRLPSLDGLEKKNLTACIQEHLFGWLPSAPACVTGETERSLPDLCGGKASVQIIRLICRADWGSFSFPVYYARPKQQDFRMPCILHINFRDQVPDEEQPTPWLMEQGVAVMTLYYQSVTADNADFTDGLAGLVYPDGNRKDNQCGKIGLWAWALLRMADYARTLPEVDSSRIAVLGHSRLGKTALLAGALDEGLYCTFSNDSGCGGAALARDNTGERVENITSNYPFWFCENYRKYSGREEEMPFDQHFLLAASYPHRVYAASAADDSWACPKNEYLSCVAASAFYERRGQTGFVHPDRLPRTGECFQAGTVGYHIRPGGHRLQQEDWTCYVRYLKQGWIPAAF